MTKQLLFVFIFMFSLTSFGNGNHGGIGVGPKLSYTAEPNDDFLKNDKYITLALNEEELSAFDSSSIAQDDSGRLYQLKGFDEVTGEAFIQEVELKTILTDLSA